MKKCAVLLSGCGVYDGSEIHEAVCTLLALDKAGVAYQCVAPDIEQHHVINHLTGEEMPETRRVLVEAARIARGNIKSLKDVDPASFDALILPGGFGAAKNLSDFAFKHTDMTIDPSVLAFCRAFAQAKKPVGFICIAPTLISQIYGPGVHVTIGNDKATAQALEKMGAVHENAAVNECVVDKAHKVVSVPAYMLAKSIGEVQSGIEKLVERVFAHF
ncbi:MAG: isoprenoid biosynthesis glyoxalase ElbB [Gammaproteobacteria bacterium]